jgi:extracellular solute-binding protein
MGKHAASDDEDLVVTSGLGLPGRLALAAAGVVTVVGAGVLIGPGQALATLPWTSGGGGSCLNQSVDIVVSPDIVSLVQQIVAPVNHSEVADNVCPVITVRGQEPQETVASSDVLPVDRAPQLWIPDSAVWGTQAQDKWPSRNAGTFAETNVVLATSRAAVKKLGWDAKVPTWHQAMLGSRPVSIPDFRSQTESLDALLSLWTSLGQGQFANNDVAGVVAAADRDELPSPDQAVSDARSGSEFAPLIPSTEQNVAYVNATSAQPNLQAVYPRQGVLTMDYPILQVVGSTPTASKATAVQRVIKQLRSPEAVQMVRKAGFRGPDGGPPVGTGIDPDYPTKLEQPTAAQVDDMTGRIDVLSKPSRILAVLDVSLSMKAKLDDGITRTTLSGAAARMGANLLPDSASVGAWLFAADMGGGKDYRVLSPVARLGSREKDGQTHRSKLINLTNNPEQYLHGGGTGLYDTTVASFKYMHRSFDPKAVNAIILMGDGGNDDAGSASLAKVLSTIKSLNKGKEKVAIYAAALGPDADFRSMKKIADASGGHAYRISTAGDGQRALLDGLRRSRNIGIGASADRG